MLYLIDTNIIVDHLRIGEAKASEFLERVEHGEIQAFISIITECELLSGKMPEKQHTAVEEILSFLPSVSATSLIARTAARLRLENNLTLPDAIVVATAIHMDAELVTRDKNLHSVKGVKVYGGI